MDQQPSARMTTEPVVCYARLIDNIGPAPFTSHSIEEFEGLLRRTASCAEKFSDHNDDALWRDPAFNFFVTDVAILLGALLFKVGVLTVRNGLLSLPRGYRLHAEGPQEEIAFSLYTSDRHDLDLTEPMPYYPYTITGDGLDEESAPRLQADLRSGWIEEVIEMARERR